MAPDGVADTPSRSPSPAAASVSASSFGKDGLTPAQARAAAHDGPILVLAGAGTGKTKTLTAAVGWRIAGMGIPASRILAVTFTNKATGEMRDRVRAMLGGGAAPSWLGTFHGLGARQLRHEPEVAGLRHGFAILDADDAQRLVKRAMVAVGLDPRPGTEGDASSPKMLSKQIGRLKDALVTPEQVAGHMTKAAIADRGASSDAADPDTVARVYAEYQCRLREANLADFGDLLLWPTLAMQRDEAYRQRWAGRWQCILADEYQDVNYGQYTWLMLLGQDHRRVFVVGDDDQSVL